MFSSKLPFSSLQYNLTLTDSHCTARDGKRKFHKRQESLSLSLSTLPTRSAPRVEKYFTVHKHGINKRFKALFASRNRLASSPSLPPTRHILFFYALRQDQNPHKTFEAQSLNRLSRPLTSLRQLRSPSARCRHPTPRRFKHAAKGTPSPFRSPPLTATLSESSWTCPPPPEHIAWPVLLHRNSVNRTASARPPLTTH